MLVLSFINRKFEVVHSFFIWHGYFKTKKDTENYVGYSCCKMNETTLNNTMNAHILALQWYIDCCGVDTFVGNTPTNMLSPDFGSFSINKCESELNAPSSISNVLQKETSIGTEPKQFLGSAEALEESKFLAKKAKTLEDLQKAIEDFEGLAIKRTAKSTVFSDGNPNAEIMIIGEAPGADEDIQGKPFVGASGKLLDTMLSYIGLSRNSDEAENSVYITNIINWRPPGNRTPNNGEITVCLPFIRKHIELIKPKIILMAGGVSAKALLATNEGITSLRKRKHIYESAGNKIDAFAIFHPSFLLRTPEKKRDAWADMIKIRKLLDSKN